MPRLSNIAKRGVGVNTRVGAAKFVSSLALRLGPDVRPSSGALIKVRPRPHPSLRPFSPLFLFFCFSLVFGVPRAFSSALLSSDRPFRQPPATVLVSARDPRNASIRHCAAPGRSPGRPAGSGCRPCKVIQSDSQSRYRLRAALLSWQHALPAAQALVAAARSEKSANAQKAFAAAVAAVARHATDTRVEKLCQVLPVGLATQPTATEASPATVVSLTKCISHLIEMSHPLATVPEQLPSSCSSVPPSPLHARVFLPRSLGLSSSRGAPGGGVCVRPRFASTQHLVTTCCTAVQEAVGMYSEPGDRPSRFVAALLMRELARGASEAFAKHVAAVPPPLSTPWGLAAPLSQGHNSAESQGFARGQ